MRALLALALIVGFSFVLLIALLAILVELFPPRQPFDEDSDDLWIQPPPAVPGCGWRRAKPWRH
jgi:hypothetical protein